MFSTNCGKWVTQSAVKYGARALDTFGESPLCFLLCLREDSM